MRMWRQTCSYSKRCFIIAALSLMPIGLAATDATVFNISRASHIAIDGNLDDWESKGFCIEQLTPAEPDQYDFDHFAWVRIAWNRDDLLVAVRVWDDCIQPATIENLAANKNLADGDSILLKLKLAEADDKIVRADFGPSQDLDTTPFLSQCCPEATPRLAAFSKLPGGYGFEAAFSWNTLGLQPYKNTQFKFQIEVRDLDPAEGCTCLNWNPLVFNGAKTSAMPSLRIDTRSSEPCGLCIWETPTIDNKRQFTAHAAAHHAGQSIRILDGCRTLAEARFTLAPDGLHAQANLQLELAEEQTQTTDSFWQIQIGTEKPVRLSAPEIALLD